MTRIETMIASCANPVTVLQLWSNIIDQVPHPTRLMIKDFEIYYVENEVLWKIKGKSLENEKQILIFRGSETVPHGFNLGGEMTTPSEYPAAILRVDLQRNDVILNIIDSLEWAEFYQSLLTSNRKNTNANL